MRGSSVIESFGNEWERFPQDKDEIADELERRFHEYFLVFPWEKLPVSAVGFDLGCGTARWARFVAPRVGKLYCIEPSSAIKVAKANLWDQKNVTFVCSRIEDLQLPSAAFDFGFSLGVLHHLDDPDSALRTCVSLLKPGAPFLLYLYYRLENRPGWFRAFWKLSTLGRRIISRAPSKLKSLVCDVIAFLVYWPFARLSHVLESLGCDVSSIPLSCYRNSSFYTMRTDALDRFGTSVEKRFSRREIQQMMESAGLKDILFSESEPFWCAVGYRNSPNAS